MLASLFSSSGNRPGPTHRPTDRRDVYPFAEQNARLVSPSVYAGFAPGSARKAIADLARATVERAIVRDTREFRFVNCHKSRHPVSDLYFPLEAKRKSSQSHLVTRSYIFALALIRPIGFLVILFLLVQLSGTYVRFRKQSRGEEGEQGGGGGSGGGRGGGG